MRKIGATIAATAMLMTGAFAAEAPTNAPLPAGKPAGTRQAALEMGGIWLVIGIAAAAGVIAAVASGTQGSTTTGTGS
jgi:hypothetical protein